MAIAEKANGVAVNFGTLSGHAGVITVVGFALYDAATVGVLRFAGLLDTSRPVVSGDSLSLAIGVLKITLAGVSGGVIGNAAALANLDAELGATTLGPATYYAALMSAMPTGAGGGTEFSAAGTYVRIAITNNNTNWPAAAMV